MNALAVQPGSSARRTLLPVDVSRQFLAFVEGRLSVPLPEGWTRSISQASYSAELDRVFFVTDRERRARQSDEDRRTEAKKFPSVHVSFSRFRDQPTLEFESGGLGTGVSGYSFIPADAPAWLREKPDGGYDRIEISAIASKERLFFINSGKDRLDTELVCLSNVNDSSAKILWRRKLDTSWIDDKGIVNVHSELRLARDCVFVFHCTQLSVGVESLRIEDGQRVFSFNSSWTSQPRVR